MNKILGHTIKVRFFFHDLKIIMLPYSHQNGIVVGKKRINSTLDVPIIEFIDSTRIWILNQEIVASKDTR